MIELFALAGVVFGVVMTLMRLGGWLLLRLGQ